MRKFKLTPDILFKAKIDSIVFISSNPDSDDIYEFSGLCLEIFNNYFITAGSFSPERDWKDPASLPDVEKLLAFCCQEKIIELVA